MPNRTKQLLKIFFIVIMMAAIFTQPVLAQDRYLTITTKENSSSVPPASASVSLGTCYPSVDGSVSDVNIVVDHAALLIAGSSYSASTTIQLAPGSYPWTWSADEGYAGSGAGTLEVGTCSMPETASGSVSLGTCYPGDPGTASLSDVNISVSHASLSIAGSSYSASTTIKLGPGSYDWTWSADEGYSGSGGGTLNVVDCSSKYQADAQFDIGVCGFNSDNDVFERDVTLTLVGASVTITGTGGAFGPFSSSQTIKIPCGDYTYAWAANDPAYEGSGSGSLHLPECDQTKADSAANIGSCGFIDGQSLTTVEIVVQNAYFTIDGNSYTETTTLKLTPGDYPYSWGPISSEFSGSGEGILSVGACETKSEDPSADVAAGGSGPSLVATLAPMMTLVFGLAFVWVATEQTKARKA